MNKVTADRGPIKGQGTEEIRNVQDFEEMKAPIF